MRAVLLSAGMLGGFFCVLPGRAMMRAFPPDLKVSDPRNFVFLESPMALEYTLIAYVALTILLLFNAWKKGIRVANGLADDKAFSYRKTLEDKFLFYVVAIVYVALALLFVDIIVAIATE